MIERIKEAVPEKSFILHTTADSSGTYLAVLEAPEAEQQELTDEEFNKLPIVFACKIRAMQDVIPFQESIFNAVQLLTREAVLKENLFQIRDALGKYFFDKQKYPTALEDLVTEKYLPKIPLDPILNSDDWALVHFEPVDMEDFDPEIAEGIIDVKSRAQLVALDGTLYADW